ncbi:hypothetical protein AXG93_3661s1430 [Marchantia polymorpha subsp. ruderalis]|uniref:DUF220 domain-containing protein n=1 Tax=Marchantia polymorpha subsp. ruderalis TaxID=1480154 RepID=A0A176VJI2_MARPO|nr:hypothetical protein AXG93_3661s1430 [Marchantia polymorpha subsp. ruderalis]
MTIDPIIQNVGRSAAQLWQGAQNFFQEIQSSVRRTIENGQQSPNSLKTKYPQINEASKGASSGSSTALRDLEPWRKNPTWEDDTPVMEVSFFTVRLCLCILFYHRGIEMPPCGCSPGLETDLSQPGVWVTVPEGSLCQLNSIFKVGLPPEAVFDILSDPGNKRVFKNIKEVKYRKLLEDHGHRQIVEIEQAAIWRFLWLSGTLNVCVRVDQDRRALTLKYDLAKEGFMKKFEGSWEIQPLYIDMDDGTDSRGRIASLVHLQQVVQPAMMPPPPFLRYVRGITTRTTEKMLEDLQEEGRRLREGRAVSELSQAEEQVHRRAVAEAEKGYVLRRHWKLHTNAGGLKRRQRRRRRRIGRFV